MRLVVVVGEEVNGGVQCASVVALVGRLVEVFQIDCRLDLRWKRSRDWSREVSRERL